MKGDKHRYIIEIIGFNDKKEWETTARLKTKPLTKAEFKKVLTKELKGRKNFCFHAKTSYGEYWKRVK
jgi:hypothetical protein